MSSSHGWAIRFPLIVYNMKFIVWYHNTLSQAETLSVPIDCQAWCYLISHYSDVIMGAIASQITSLTIFFSTVYSGADQLKYQSSASLAFVRGIHRWPVNSPHKWPVTPKMFPFDNVIIIYIKLACSCHQRCRSRTHYTLKIKDDFAIANARGFIFQNRFIL